MVVDTQVFPHRLHHWFHYPPPRVKLAKHTMLHLGTLLTESALGVLTLNTFLKSMGNLGLGVIWHEWVNWDRFALRNEHFTILQFPFFKSFNSLNVKNVKINVSS